MTCGLIRSSSSTSMTSIFVARRKLKELGWVPGRFLSCMPAPAPWASTAGALHTPSIWRNMVKYDVAGVAGAFKGEGGFGSLEEREDDTRTNGCRHGPFHRFMFWAVKLHRRCNPVGLRP